MDFGSQSLYRFYNMRLLLSLHHHESMFCCVIWEFKNLPTSREKKVPPPGIPPWLPGEPRPPTSTITTFISLSGLPFWLYGLQWAVIQINKNVGPTWYFKWDVFARQSDRAASFGSALQNRSPRDAERLWVQHKVACSKTSSRVRSAWKMKAINDGCIYQHSGRNLLYLKHNPHPPLSTLSGVRTETLRRI